jgi:uncharacterized protein YjiS (DUF1127 family)
MMHEDVRQIVNKHIECDRIIEAALMSGDYRKNNREVKKLNRLTAPLKDDLELARQVYSELFKADCVRSRCHASVECLRIGVLENDAVTILEELSKRDDIGITRLGSEMALKLWRGEIPGKTL